MRDQQRLLDAPVMLVERVAATAPALLGEVLACVHLEVGTRVVEGGEFCVLEMFEDPGRKNVGGDLTLGRGKRELSQ